MTSDEERLHILEMIRSGQITVDQGAELLEALGDESDTDGSAADSTSPDPSPPMDVPAFSNWWLIPLWIGTAILILGALLLSAAYQGSGWFLMVCGWPVFLIGLLVIIAAWFSRAGPWVHIRVQQRKSGRHDIRLSLPLNLSVSVLKVIGRFIPQLKETGVDDMLIAMKDGVKPEQPLIIDVNEEEDGEHIQVVIG